MTDSKALIERLRADWPEILVEKHWMMDSDAIEEQRREAADHIEKLEADNIQLQVDSEPSPYCPICGSCGEEGCCGDKRCQYPDTGLTDHIEKLEADNARLREALGEVWDWIGNWSPNFIWDDEWPATEAKARAALQETSHDA